MPKRQTGPKLPASLLSQLTSSQGTKQSARAGISHLQGRKLPRREQRQQSRRKQGSSHKLRVVHNDIEGAENSSPEDEVAESPRPISGNTRSARSDEHSSASENDDPQHNTKVTSQKRSKHLLDDDRQIAALENKLGIKNRSKLPKAFEEDGLDVLLGGLDAEDVDDDGWGIDGPETAEDKAWLRRKRRKVDTTLSAPDKHENSDEVSSQESGYSDDEAGWESEEEVPSVSGADSLEEENDSDAVASVEPAKKTRENPYVAPGTTSFKEPGKYIPPSLRTQNASEVESTSRLKRQFRGLLNRLSESNLTSVLKDIEKLYLENPRQLVTSTLAEVLVDLFRDPSVLNDTFIVLHAAFAAAVYKVVGSDFGAYLIERVIVLLGISLKQNEKRSLPDSHAGEDNSTDKGRLNLTSFLDRMYQFQICNCTLIFNLIQRYLDNMKLSLEFHTELLLRMIKDVGPQLRHDDPQMLKEVVLKVQSTISGIDQAEVTVRTKFMIEVLTELKNNKMKASFAASGVVQEHVTRLKKILGSLNTRSLRASEPLRISLDDIERSSKKGKWWLVGASWKGNDTDEPSKTSVSEVSVRQEFLKKRVDFIDDEADELWEAAKELRMNTDVRRGIFVAIMSASDYKDAYARLIKLRLKRSQEVEIPRVLLNCAGAEKEYNPYYALVAKKVCGDRKLKKIFHFAFWDLFNRLKEDGSHGSSAGDETSRLGYSNIVNIAKLCASLVLSGAINLEMLKVLDLIYLDAKTSVFAEILMVTVLLQAGAKKKSHTFEKLFSTVAELPELNKGLQYFLRKVVAKSDLVESVSQKETIRTGCKEALKVLSVPATERADA